MLPLAIPTYISAYAWVEFIGFTGPVQEALRAVTGAQTLQDYWFPSLAGVPGAAFVMSLVLYPYVYMTCRAFFLMQSGNVESAARTLGASPRRAFFRIVLPLSRPALIVGTTLAMMEVVNDLGAVEYFGVKSLTAVVYATWVNRSNLAGAAQLALTLVGVIFALIWLEQWARKQRRFLNRRDTATPAPRAPLQAGGAALAVLFCMLVIGLGFGVPVAELLSTAIGRFSRGAVPAGLAPAALQTLSLALMGAVICMGLGYLTTRQLHAEGRTGRGLIRLSILGYALPGTVLALGLIVPLGLIDGWINRAIMGLGGQPVGLVLSGSLAALLYAYAIRFLAVSHNTVEAARRRRGDNMLDAARVLGARRWRLFFRIELPTLRPALVGAAILVFVEVVKELPATLLLRPLGVETLATYVYQQAGIERFEAASVPAMLIIAAGLVPVMFLSRLSEGQKGQA